MEIYFTCSGNVLPWRNSGNTSSRVSSDRKSKIPLNPWVWILGDILNLYVSCYNKCFILLPDMKWKQSVLHRAGSQSCLLHTGRDWMNQPPTDPLKELVKCEEGNGTQWTTRGPFLTWLFLKIIVYQWENISPYMGLIRLSNCSPTPQRKLIIDL